MTPLERLQVKILMPIKPLKKVKPKYNKTGSLIKPTELALDYPVNIKNEIATIKLLSISPFFTKHIENFRNTYGLVGNEFSLKDLKVLDEDAFSEWKIETHTYKVQLRFTKFFDLGKGRKIYIKAIKFAENLTEQKEMVAVKNYIKKLEVIILMILLTSKADLRKRLKSPGITIQNGYSLQQNIKSLEDISHKSTFIEVEPGVTVPQLVSYIKNRFPSVNPHIKSLNIDNDALELLRYGFIKDYGKYNKLRRENTKFKEKTAIDLKYQFKQKKKYLIEKDLLKLFGDV